MTPAASRHAPVRRRHLPAMLSILLLIGAASPWLLTGPSRPAALDWLLDLSTHWHWANLPLALVLAVTLRGARAARGVALLAAAVSAGQLWLAHVPLEREAAGQPTLRIAQANVLKSNPDPLRLLVWIRRQSPDVIVLQEVPPEWSPALAGLAGYPYRKVAPRADGFGLAVLSKHPFDQPPRLLDDGSDPPALAVRIRWQGTALNLTAVHPMPPFTPHFGGRRDARLAQAARELARPDEPGLLVGDFNATPWSTGASVVESAGLRRMTGVRPSWPAQLGPLAVLPIDHVAATGHWRVVSRERGPDVGSDHFPVLVGLQRSDGDRPERMRVERSPAGIDQVRLARTADGPAVQPSPM